MTREEAIYLRSIVEQAAAFLDDKVASTAALLYPRMKYNGSLIPAGTRINWNGEIKRAAVDLWATAENNPDNAPTLWEDIEYKQGYRIIPDAITATQAFSKDEYGWWSGELYRSLIDSNVWTPVQYPAGWNKVD